VTVSLPGLSALGLSRYIINVVIDKTARRRQGFAALPDHRKLPADRPFDFDRQASAKSGMTKRATGWIQKSTVRSHKRTWCSDYEQESVKLEPAVLSFGKNCSAHTNRLGAKSVAKRCCSSMPLNQHANKSLRSTKR